MKWVSPVPGFFPNTWYRLYLDDASEIQTEEIPEPAPLTVEERMALDTITLTSEPRFGPRKEPDEPGVIEYDDGINIPTSYDPAGKSQMAEYAPLKRDPLSYHVVYPDGRRVCIGTTFAGHMEAMGYTIEKKRRLGYSIMREAFDSSPDLMSAIRDIARGS